MRTVHHDVDHQSAFVTEQFGETSGALLGNKLEVSGNFTTRRQRTPLRRHTLDVPAQLNLFDEERLASLAVRCAFIGKAYLVGFCQLQGGAGLSLSVMTPPLFLCTAG